MDKTQKLQKAIQLERQGNLEAAIQLYGEVWRAENRPRKGMSIEGMWRLGLVIFEERRRFLEIALAQTKLTITMEEGLAYLKDIPQSLSLLSEYFYDEKNIEVFRSNTIKAVGLLDDPRRIPFLSDLLVHPNIRFRVRAIYALNREPTDIALKPLKRALTNEQQEVRFTALHALFHRKQAEALAIALQQAPTREEQYRIVHMLGKLKHAPAAPVFQRLIYSEDRELIRLCIEALVAIEHVDSLPLIREMGDRFPEDGKIRQAYRTLWRKSLMEGLEEG